MPHDEIVEHLAHGVADHVDLARAADLAPEGRGDPHDRHAFTVPRVQNST